MCLCVLVSLYVLVNGSHIKEVNIQRVLKKMDQLASFYFLLLTGELGGLMRECGSFTTINM